MRTPRGELPLIYVEGVRRYDIEVFEDGVRQFGVPARTPEVEACYAAYEQAPHRTAVLPIVIADRRAT